LIGDSITVQSKILIYFMGLDIHLGRHSIWELIIKFQEIGEVVKVDIGILRNIRKL
jgi:hypothetical protein